MKKDLDQILSMTLNKNARVPDKRPIQRQIHLELSQIFSNEEIKEAGRELKLIKDTTDTDSMINDLPEKLVMK